MVLLTQLAQLSQLSFVFCHNGSLTHFQAGDGLDRMMLFGWLFVCGQCTHIKPQKTVFMLPFPQ